MNWIYLPNANLSLNLDNVTEIYWELENKEKTDIGTVIIWAQTNSVDLPPCTEITNTPDRRTLRLILIGDNWEPKVAPEVQDAGEHNPYNLEET